MGYMKARADDEARKQGGVSDAPDDASLMCAAQGCPNRWSVRMDGPGLCRAHAFAEPREWPRITQAEQDAMTDRARMRSFKAAEPAPSQVTPQQGPLILASAMQELHADTRSPAQRVRDRLLEIERERGQLNPAQRQQLDAINRMLGARPDREEALRLADEQRHISERIQRQMDLEDA